MSPRRIVRALTVVLCVLVLVTLASGHFPLPLNAFATGVLASCAIGVLVMLAV